MLALIITTLGQCMKYLTLAVTAMAVLMPFSALAGSPQDEGVLLSQADYVYLDSQGVMPNSPILQNMSPKELRRLHWTINGELSKKNLIFRDNAVRDALAEFKGHQLWEQINPGHLWDETPVWPIPN